MLTSLSIVLLEVVGAAASENVSLESKGTLLIKKQRHTGREWWYQSVPDTRLLAAAVVSRKGI